MHRAQREIGGYFELECYPGLGFHPDAVALNCGRGCLAYDIELRGIRRMWVPMLMCDSVFELLARENVAVLPYKIKEGSFSPDWTTLSPSTHDWLLLMDYYGQLTRDTVEEALSYFPNAVLVDETQGFFRPAWTGADTFWSCRKWFGVADGGYLATSDGMRLSRELPQDESYGRYGYVLGRVERPAGEFFTESTANNKRFASEPAKIMSQVTKFLLGPIDYMGAQMRRDTNWATLDAALRHLNKLDLHAPKGSFMYPFMTSHAQEIRKKLIAAGVFVPVLWPNVLVEQPLGSWERCVAEDILPLPIDQRYETEDMAYISQLVLEFIS